MKVRKKPQALVVGRGHAGLRERTCIPLHTTVSNTIEGENHAPKKRRPNPVGVRPPWVTGQ